MRRLLFVLVSAVAGIAALSAGAGVAAAAEPAAAPAVYLGEAGGSAVYGNGSTRTGMLLREIARQTLWVTAREDCGLKLRDAWLEDGPSEAEAAAIAQGRVLDLAISPGNENLVELIDGLAPQAAVFDTGKFTLPPKVAFDYVVYLNAMNDLARKQWVRALARQYGGRARVAAPADAAAEAKAAAAAAALEPHLAKLTYAEQYLAIRKSHQAIAEYGETSPLLGALVRGYANLGMLTDTHFNPAHKVFHARALVYAERLVWRETATPWSLAHRAYTTALAGLEKNSLADLAAVDRAAENESGAGRSLPAWVAVIDDYCHYRIAALGAVAEDKPEFQLSRALRYVAITHTGDTPRMVEAALETSETLPELYFVADGFLELIEHSFTFENKEIDWREPYGDLDDARNDSLGTRLYASIAALEGLPEGTAQVLAPANLQGLKPQTEAEYALRGRLIAALTAVNDDSPLPWSVLGRIVREASFRQAFYPHEDGRYGIVRSFDPKWEPLVAAHPYRPFFDTRDDSAAPRPDSLDQLSRAIRFGGIERAAHRVGSAFWLSGSSGQTSAARAAANRFGNATLANTDHITRERLSDVAYRFTEDSGRLLEINPNLPRAVQMALMFKPDKYVDRLEAWKGLADDHPAIAALLEKQAAKSKSPEEQEKLLLAAFAKNPDPEITKTLMQLQWNRKDLDAWETTMRTFIERSARTQDALDACCGAARSLIRLRMFERAKPFAEAAVEYKDADGRLVSGLVNEGLQDWPAAEKEYQEYSATHSKRRCEWYFFSRRTGQGDRAKALEQAREQMRFHENPRLLDAVPHDTGDVLTVQDNPIPALYYLLDHDAERALPRLRENFIHNDDPQWGIYAALAADRLGNKAECSTLLKVAADRGLNYRVGQIRAGRQRTGLVGLAKLLHADYSAGAKGLDAAAVDKLRGETHSNDLTEFDAILGLYYEQRENEAAAIEAWLRVMASPQMAAFGRTLSGARLWERNITPSRYRDALAGRTTEGK